MTVQERIRWLESLNVPDAEVRAYDPNSEKDEPVTGGVYNATVITLYTDEP